MKAILLAAGVGKRMGLKAPPKCLLEVGGQSILQRNLDALKTVGIAEAVLVVGHQAEKVRAHAETHARGLTLTVLANPRYQEGAILSLWTARGHLDEDLIIMDSDVLFPPVVLERLIRSSHSNCLLVDASSPDTGEEQIVLGKGGRVRTITKSPSEELKRSMTVLGESIGFLKLSRSAAQILRQLLEERVEQGDVGVEHEQVYPDLFDQVEVGFERVNGLPWIEIDTHLDLRRARQEVFPQWEPWLCINRWLSRLFIPWVVKLPVTPNQWTGLSFLLGLASLGFIGRGDPNALLLGALFFQGFYLVDNWDGDVARLKGLSSPRGAWFDLWVDAVIQTALPWAITWGLIRQGADFSVLWLGGIASVGLALDFGITYWAKLRGFGPSIYGDPSRVKTKRTDSALAGWVKANLTHENFSLLLVGVLFLDGRWAFLALTAVGAQVYWIQFLLRERSRLFPLG